VKDKCSDWKGSLEGVNRNVEVRRINVEGVKDKCRKCEDYSKC
jgi:hypothetical protein